MNCKKCGSPLSENDQFCKNCGAAVNAQNEQVNVQQPINNPLNQQPVNNTVDQQPMNNQVAQQPYQQPQQNYNQPAWANGYNSNPNYQPPKSNENLKYIIIGVVVVVVIFAIVIMVSMFKGKDNNKSNEGTNNGSSVNEGLPSVSETTNTTSTYYKVNFKGFTLSIPDNLVYEEKSGILSIGDEEGTWITELELEQGSFTQLKNNKNQFPIALRQKGYTCTEATEKILGGVEFITMEISFGGENFIAALTKANSMYYIGVTAYNQENEIDYKLLETIAPIINSFEQTSASNSIAPDNTLDFSIFNDLAK